MSGHSKWSTIKRKKGAEDAKRGKLFTRFARDIMVAAREGGGDESTNPRLKDAIAKAKANNMPKDNIERAVKKGTGELEGGQLEEMTYEAYGIDGVAFIIEMLTDNKNRALADVKHVINKHNGNLAESGSVSWQFEIKGYIVIDDTEDVDFEELFMVAAEAGADDVSQEDGQIIIYTPREMYGPVTQELSDQGYTMRESELRWEPKNEIEVSVDSAVKNIRIIEKLEDLDDVQSVSSNLKITGEIASAYETA